MPYDPEQGMSENARAMVKRLVPDVDMYGDYTLYVGRRGVDLSHVRTEECARACDWSLLRRYLVTKLWPHVVGPIPPHRHLGQGRGAAA